MGQEPTTELKRESARISNKADLEDIYCMFEETMDAVRTSRIGQDRGKSHIRNLQEVLEQLLGCFSAKENYLWGKDIAALFKKHFRDRFEEMWPIDKEQFYKELLSHCNFQTIDFKQELEEIALNMDIHDLAQRRMSYQRYFYEVGKARMEERLPSSFIGQDLPWEESFHQPGEQEAQFNMCAINQTIINHEQDILKDNQHPDADFLPLFTHSKPTSALPRSPGKQETLRVQNASIISPQTVFYQRLPVEKKAQISDLVKFYRQFANALQQMFFSSTSMVSAPYKHFLTHLDQKTKRKNIRPSKRRNVLLYANSPEGRDYRQRRAFNTKLLLTEIREFAEAYTDFVWMFLELNQIGESQLGRLLNIYTLYGIVVKSVWKFVEWLSDRGCEYEEQSIEQYCLSKPQPLSRLPPFQKQALLPLLRALVDEKNPQKYLKKIVVFYREANKVCECADDLLALYEELIVKLIRQGMAKKIAIFRMPILIESLLKLEEALSSAGEISYSWTTWCVVIQMLRKRIDCPDSPAYQSNLLTEPDFEEVLLDQ